MRTYKGILLILFIILTTIASINTKYDLRPKKIERGEKSVYLEDSVSISNQVLTIFDSIGLMDDIEK
ncbi:hypothetical protein [Sediminitomix flava]|uniref:Uncharacterized protein n=1 Tax=Sediminitomix flava TaxID=379075 RepID=A0A315Z9S9_SEDFL|nr:hypothetical protein [Sediminitomix flava]PWJ40820.1 hypothetical protein BC781_10479 [Sediminitomix flava]